MHHDRSGQTALVTGASRGIGEALVRSLVKRGMTVHALALDDDDLHRVADETGCQAHGVDIRDIEAVAATLDGLEFDVVINNAGVLPTVEPFTDNDSATIDRTLDVNLRAALHITRLTLPAMQRRDCGHLFYLGSIAGRHPGPNAAVYAASKAALHAFAEGLRCDLLGSNIRVTTLMPGRVQTRLYDDALGSHQRAEDALYRDFEAVQPDDVAAVVNTALDMPDNVDLTAIEVLPTKQIFGGSAIARESR